MNDSEKFESERIGALWRRTSKKGMEYLRGEVNGEHLVAFPTTKKWQKNSPDYQVFKSLPTPTEKEEKKPPKPKVEKEGPAEKDEKEVPF